VVSDQFGYRDGIHLTTMQTDGMKSKKQAPSAFQAILSVVRREWDAMGKPPWDTAQLARFLDALENLTQAAEDSGDTATAERALDVEIFLSCFADGSVQPEPQHWKELQPLVSGLLAAPTESDTDTSTGKRSAQPRRVYYLHPGDASNLHLTHVLAEHRFSIRPFTVIQDVLNALDHGLPDALVVDAEFLEDIPNLIRVANTDLDANTPRAALVVVSRENDADQRLIALRGGADAYFGPDALAKDIAAQLCALTYGASGNRFRVLVVDDMKQQCKFYDAILRGAGFVTRYETDSSLALQAVQTFAPDLILTDLYMPGIDGMAFTAQLRDDPHFSQLPIIVLSGETDEEARFNALSIGADDYLTKPIAPRFLIAAVSGRVRRARELRRRLDNSLQTDPATGLYRSGYFLHLLENQCQSVKKDQRCALLHIEIDEIDQLRHELGVDGTEQLMGELGRLLHSQVMPHGVVSQSGFGSILIYLPHRKTGVNNEQQARKLCQAVADHVFICNHSSWSITISVGLCPLVKSIHRGPLLASAEQACIDAQHAGGNRVCTGQARATTESDETQVIASLIGGGELDTHFKPLFRPILSVHASRMPVYRVSLHLHNPDGPPFLRHQYLPVARKTQLELKLDEISVRSVVEGLVASREVAPQIFVPLSADAMQHGDLFRQLYRQLRRAGIAPHRVVVEFSAPELRRHVKRATAWLPKFSKSGMRTCIAGVDGSANALQIIRTVVSDFVRLDPQLSANLGQDESAEEAILHCITQAKELGRQVVVPGLNEAEMIARLWNSGVDFLEGPIIGQPRHRMDFDFSTVFE